jgi:hypothetical protein
VKAQQVFEAELLVALAQLPLDRARGQLVGEVKDLA